MLKATLVSFTWFFAVVFLALETYVTWLSGSHPAFDTVLASEYAVNVCGVGIMLWGLARLRRRRPYAEGVIAAAWAWMTAVFWRGTNLRYRLAAQGEPLMAGRAELWLAPIATMIVAAGLVASLALLLRKLDDRLSSQRQTPDLGR